MLVLLDTDPRRIAPGKYRADLFAEENDPDLNRPLYMNDDELVALARWLEPALQFQARRESYIVEHPGIGLDSPDVDGLELGPQPGVTFVLTLPVRA